MPWISHTCHRRLEALCTVNAGTCSKYRAIKECCCDVETKLECKLTRTLRRIAYRPDRPFGHKPEAVSSTAWSTLKVHPAVSHS
uniref:CCC domain-containing protein n=1 Tax=Anopheles stephensi TaxID=30069 RepID=A0A182YAE5_ANOST